MDAPPELEGRLVMQAEEHAWASGPGPEEPGRAEPETFRRCFRQLCYQDVSGPREAFSKLWELCCRWLRPEVRSKQQILELLVIEQFLTILPEKMRAWAQTRRPGSGEEAVALVTHLEKEAGRLRQQVRARVAGNGLRLGRKGVAKAGGQGRWREAFEVNALRGGSELHIK